MTKTNQKGIDLIKSFEGCKLEAYQDIKGIWTIGYGDTNNVQPGMKITQEEADDRLRNRLVEFETGISSCVKVSINENQFSALVCFSYNVGLGALKSSTLLKLLNDNKYSEASDQFLQWDKANGVVVSGLLRRRTAEKVLFLS